MGTSAWSRIARRRGRERKRRGRARGAENFAILGPVSGRRMNANPFPSQASAAPLAANFAHASIALCRSLLHGCAVTSPVMRSRLTYLFLFSVLTLAWGQGGSNPSTGSFPSGSFPSGGSPYTTQPPTTQPETTQPQTTQPQTTQPQTTQPQTEQPQQQTTTPPPPTTQRQEATNTTPPVSLLFSLPFLSISSLLALALAPLPTRSSPSPSADADTDHPQC